MSTEFKQAYDKACRESDPYVLAMTAIRNTARVVADSLNPQQLETIAKAQAKVRDAKAQLQVATSAVHLAVLEVFKQ